MQYKDFFKGKRILVVGLGEEMEMLPEIKFLVKVKAEVTVVDSRSEIRLEKSLVALRALGLANIFLGSYKEGHFSDKDIIIRAQNIPDTAQCFSFSEIRNIPIDTAETLFLKLAPIITLIGVLGTCGKSTVAGLVHAILDKAYGTKEEQRIYSIDPAGKNGSLALLRTVKKGDVVVARIPYHQLSAYVTARISPHVAVFTNLVPDRGGRTIGDSIAYAQALFKVLDTQTYNNFIVASDEVIDTIKSYAEIQPKSKMLRTSSSIIPSDWILQSNTLHERENVCLALRVAELFKVSQDVERDVVEHWQSLKGRLELVKVVQGVSFYNDSASTTPFATLAGLKALASNRNIVLIMGGAGNSVDITSLLEVLAQYVSCVVTIPGSGTLRFHNQLMALKEVKYCYASTIDEAAQCAKDSAGRGDIVLFSPAFASDGVANSWKDRGDKFVRAVKRLK